MNEKSLRQRILEMEVGDEIIISMADYTYTTIRTYASDLGFAEQKTFTTHRNRESRTYTFARTA